MQIFRNMTEQDVVQIAELEKKVFSDAWTSTGIYETFCQNQAFVAVAECDGDIVGYCIIYYVMDEGEIARIAVDKKMRRKGVGCGLLDYVCECCKIKNINRLLLDVRESNVPALNLYRSFGFAEDGIRKNFYQNPTEHAVLMSMSIV